MAIQEYSPLGKKSTHVIVTSNTLIQQVWAEFVLLRHMGSKHKIKAPKSIAPWIDQARTYFLDASQSHWRSGGLLYYYSFLNLAKAYLVAKGPYRYKDLDTTSIYHGLSADLQSIHYFTDFEMKIFPPTYRGYKNIFAQLYEAVTGQKWPFQNKISIKLSEVAGHCKLISLELESLFNIKHQIIRILSALRIFNNKTWFEMLVPDSASSDTIRQQVEDWELDAISSSELSEIDKLLWNQTLNITAKQLAGRTFLRSQKRDFDNGNREDIVNTVVKEADKKLEQYALPSCFYDDVLNYWLFVPKLNINGNDMPWHPLLSDYLFAFALSSILRYQPQILKPNSPNSFFAQSWSSQSAITTLRYFLMLFTQPSIVIKTI